MVDYCLRLAIEDDTPKIINLITQSNLDTTNLEWKHFVIVETDDRTFVGCGQIKSHEDGSSELASIAIDEKYRGQGIGRLIINSLLSKSERPLFLVCRLGLIKFYQKFGFSQVTWGKQSSYFRKNWWIFVLDRIICFITRREHLVVMWLE